MTSLHIFVLILVIKFGFTDDSPISEMQILLDVQKNLTHSIFINNTYDREIAPLPLLNLTMADEFFNNSNNILIYILYVSEIKLIDIDEPKEQMTVIMELSQSWKDVRLRWPPRNWSDITVIFTRLDKIWSPPLIVFGASEVVEHRDQSNRMVKIDYRGVVDSHIPLKMTTNCKMNMTEFPFDTQICEIQIGLPSFQAKQFKILVEAPQDIENSCNLGNSAWHVMNITFESINIRPEDERTDAINMAVIQLHLKRNPMYYMYMIVLPTFIINAISMAGVFWKSGEKMERLTVGLTHIMTLTFILGIIADKLPKTAVIPLLGKYIIFGLCTMIFAIIFSTYLDKLSIWKISGKNVRRTQLRGLFIIFFQLINWLGGVYILWRLMDFEAKFPDTKCL